MKEGIKMFKIEKPTKEELRNGKEKKKAQNSATSHSIIDNVLYILNETRKACPQMFLLSIIAILAVTASDICGTYTNKYVVELVLGEESRVKLAISTFLFIFGTRFLGGVKNIAYKYKNIASIKFRNHFLKKLMIKNMKTDYENGENPKISDMLQKASNDLYYTTSGAFNLLESTFLSIVSVMAFQGILANLTPLMILIAGVPVLIVCYISEKKLVWRIYMKNRWQRIDRKLLYIPDIASDYKRAKDFRIFGLSKWFEKKYEAFFQERLYWHKQSDLWNFLHDIMEIIVNDFGMFIAYIYIIYSVVKGNIGAGDFILYLNAIKKLSGSVKSLTRNLLEYQDLSDKISSSRDYCDIKDKTNHGNGKDFPKENYEIEFRNVSYTYPNAKNPTIKNISFKLNKEEKLALVGLNGAGKTTLIKLMCGLYDPTEGEILLNGINVKDFNREEYFKQFSAVFQDITILPTTIAENIASEELKDLDREKVLECLKTSGLYKKVMELPKKEETYLVKTVYEDAIELSGGQMQKLALAKALYKNAPILLLDEPTAALDPISEQEMYQNYAKFSKSKASVFISHRLASTRFCDRIILIENGEIAEYGTHSELMNLNGKYAELFKIQSSYYNDKEVEKV